MRRAIMTLKAVCAFTFAALACIPPDNIEGVAFTSGEKLNLQNLIKLGAEKANYFKDGEDPNIVIRYKSHYDPRAMVFVGNIACGFHRGDVRMNCLGVVLPLADTAHQRIIATDKSVFNFAAAVKTELKWLVSNDIIVIERKAITRIDSALCSSGNGGVQYWTHASSVLGYHAWYIYDSVACAWSLTRGTARGGCAVVQPTIGLPPNDLETGVSTLKTAAFPKNIQPLWVRRLGNGVWIVFFPQKPRTDALLTVTDLRGALVYTKHIPADVLSLYINGLTFSYYVFRLNTKALR
jgi:hypothetical protein